MIDTDKYDRYSLHTKKKLKRNWRLKVTQPDIDNSVEAFNGYDTDMPMQGYEDIVAVDSLGRERYTVAQMVDTGWEDAQLIADAPLLLEEVKRLQHCLRYVGARLYMDKNNYRHYDYAKLLDFCRRNSGEPDDMSGPMGAMIKDLRYYDGKLEGDEE